MASKPKRTKRYQGPKYVARNPIKTFFGGMSDTHAEEALEINAKNSAALQAMVQGRGCRDGWDRLIGAVNVANVLCEQLVGAEYREQILAARDAMLEVGKRGVKTSRFGLTGDELKVMNEFLDIHEAQIAAVRAIDIDRAADEVIRRVRGKINSTNVQAELAKEAA